MAAFPFPLVECRGVDALHEWAELRKLGKAEGSYPIIVGDDRDKELLNEALEINDDDPPTIIARADSLDGMELLEARASLDPEVYGDIAPGDWPAQVSPQPITSHTDLKTGKPKAKVYLAQFPTPHSHEVPAYLRCGGWNDCPSADEHVAIHRMWQAEYGAEIIAVTGDIIECTVARPPSTNAAASHLARQQFIYCRDIVYQGVQHLSVLAAGLKNHDTWYFWWD